MQTLLKNWRIVPVVLDVVHERKLREKYEHIKTIERK